MLKISICIGSSCHLKGSRQVVEELQYLVEKNNLKDKIDLSGKFCMGKCNTDGVSVTINEDYYAVKPEETKKFFTDVILKKL
jgi:NADH:ubiquinone oxidoreductase subunit E